MSAMATRSRTRQCSVGSTVFPLAFNVMAIELQGLVDSTRDLLAAKRKSLRPFAYDCGVSYDVCGAGLQRAS